MKTVMVSAVLAATAAGLLASSTAYAFVAPSPAARAVLEATASRRQHAALCTAATSSSKLVNCCGRPRARPASLSMMVSPSTGSTPGERGGSLLVAPSCWLGEGGCDDVACSDHAQQ